VSSDYFFFFLIKKYDAYTFYIRINRFIGVFDIEKLVSLFCIISYIKNIFYQYWKIINDFGSNLIQKLSYNIKL
jgi:hypothetical protein